MSFTNTADPLTLILEQLTSMNERLIALESRPTNVAQQANVPPAAADPPVQHGIRAKEPWQDPNFILSREPTKYVFRLEHQKDYNVWSFSVLRILEAEGLAPFVLGTVPEPVILN